MAVDPNRLDFLLEKFSQNEVSEAEFEELCELINDHENEPAIKGILQQGLHNAPFARLDQTKMDKMLSKVLLTESKPVRRLYPFRRIAAAAAAIIVLVLGAGAWYGFFNHKKGNEVAVSNPALPTDVKAPATNRAMVTLANGQSVYLDSVNNGQLALQGNVKLVKLANGQIAYSALQQGFDGAQPDKGGNELVYNTLTNPRGSKVIDMTLSDGSRVWLNAGSSVTYPVAFVGKERKVSITGEAYFEVAHDADKPFKVGKGGMEVTVLGTHFNVNAYDDEQAIKLTLLEGSVRVTLGQGFGGAQPDKGDRPSLIIAPGQQAVLRQAQDDIHVVNDVDVDGVMAWKNGYFQFSGSDVPTVMRQIARWYDVDVSYEGQIPERRFAGQMDRHANLSKVLRILEESNVHFRLEGRKLIVMP
ncbi:MAG: FecR domain-containing protein [Flavisolibacter sp.]|nr:FecR domain-containing protein [Flavisolibacter sp.]